jgi:hypothetical protein
MRNIKFIRNILLAIVLIGLFGCEDKYASGPAIAWTGGMITYTYSGGVLSGFTIIVRFEVTDDQSGDIKVTASHSGEKISSIATVVPGVEYKVRVGCNLSSSGATGSILIDSPSAEDTYTVTNRDNKISMGSITIE